MVARLALVALAVVSFGAAACSAASDEPGVGEEGDEVKVDTRTPSARKQYDANVAFVNGYAARCAKTSSGRPRILVSGFGRFMGIDDNATGRIISALVASATYPQTQSPPSGEIDPPGPQLEVVSATIELPKTGPVDICAMILPVYWDLASILIAKEMEAFEPSLVMMNGVAGSRQPIWIELGSTNKASALDDGSNQLRPAVSDNEDFAPIIQGGEDARPNLLSWNAALSAAASRIEARKEEMDEDTRLGEVLQGAKLAGFPRSSNTYLCNNVTYVTGYLMDHPNRTVKLLRAKPALSGKINSVNVKMTKDFRATPRVFVHWPSDMATMHHAAGADVMSAILDAQLQAIAHGDAPTAGDDELADPSLQGGKFF